MAIKIRQLVVYLPAAEEEDDSLVLERVAELVDEGFTEGYEPRWAIADGYLFQVGDWVYAPDNDNVTYEGVVREVVAPCEQGADQLLLIKLAHGREIRVTNRMCIPV